MLYNLLILPYQDKTIISPLEYHNLTSHNLYSLNLSVSHSSSLSFSLIIINFYTLYNASTITRKNKRRWSEAVNKQTTQINKHEEEKPLPELERLWSSSSFLIRASTSEVNFHLPLHQQLLPFCSVSFEEPKP